MAKKEKAPESKKEARERERIERDRERYLAYWLTLSPRDRERVPEP